MSHTPPVAEAQEQVTAALRDYRSGQEGSFEHLVELVYSDLHRLAHLQLRKQPSDHLDTTVLVHELYLKLVDREEVPWQDRGHFFAACARAMRNILIDAARRSSRHKRGGNQEDLSLIEVVVGAQAADADWLLAVDEALEQLAAHDSGLAKIFELRFFGGYSAAESAELMDLSKRTVERRWNRACAWLRLVIGPASGGTAGFSRKTSS